MKKLAIVGLGGWGRRLVDSVFGKSDIVQFTTAVVRDPATSRDYAASRNLEVTTDLAEVLRDSNVDGIVSSGPAQLHAAHSLAALEAGKPVLAVKPMALDPRDADNLVEAAERRGVGRASCGGQSAR